MIALSLPTLKHCILEQEAFEAKQQIEAFKLKVTQLEDEKMKRIQEMIVLQNENGLGFKDFLDLSYDAAGSADPATPSVHGTPSVPWTTKGEAWLQVFTLTKQGPASLGWAPDMVSRSAAVIAT